MTSSSPLLLRRGGRILQGDRAHAVGWLVGPQQCVRTGLLLLQVLRRRDVYALCCGRLGAAFIGVQSWSTGWLCEVVC